MARKTYTPILGKYAQNKAANANTKKATTKTSPIPAAQLKLNYNTNQKAAVAKGGITLPTNTKILSKGQEKDAALLNAAKAAAPINLAKSNTSQSTLLSKAASKLPNANVKSYNPALGRMGISPTKAQDEKRQAQNLKDVKSSTIIRASVGAAQGISPVNLKLDKKVQKELDASAAYQVGKIGGTLAGFAIPYGGASKTVMSGAAKFAPKILTAAEAATAKGLQKVLPRLGAEAAEAAGKAVVKNTVTSAVIGTPLNINQAVNKEGLRGRKAVQSVAVNGALDLIAGGALEAAPYILKSGKQVFNNVHFKQLKPEEQTEIIEAVVERNQLALPAPKNQGPTLYGTEKGLSQNLPSAESQAYQQWRKDNFGGAFGKMSPEDERAMQDLYIESKTPDYSGAVGKTETPFTVRPGEISVQGLPRANKAENIASQLGNVEQGINAPKAKSAALKMDNTYASKTIDIPKGMRDSLAKNLSPVKEKEVKIASVMSNSKVEKPTKLETLAGITSSIKRKFSDAGDTVSKISKMNDDKSLYHYYNNARNSKQRAEYMIGNAQTDIMGNEVGKSLKSIFDPIRKQGDEFYNKFQEYMYHLHNVDRMAQEKPVFGETVSAETSAKEADRLLKENPEFSDYKDEIQTYIKNLMDYRVSSGLVSRDSADTMAEMYKNYVPTFREQPKVKGINSAGSAANISKTVKTATGGSSDLLPLHEQLSKQTMQTVDAAHKNLFGLRLLNNATDKTAAYIQDIKKITKDLDIDKNIEDSPELRNAFNIFINGEGHQLKVDKTLYEGIKALENKDPSDLFQIASKAVRAFKTPITNWSPFFLIRNAARDIQEVGLTSTDLKGFVKAYPAAVKEIATDGPLWKLYKSLGGEGSSFFDYAKGYKDDPSWLKKNTVDRITALNVGIEQAPRVAEFMAHLSKIDGAPTYDDLMEAMYKGAEVTTNFGRTGTWGKVLNQTAVPFFNPSVQGASKLVRTFTETKGAKAWTSLALKISALGFAPSLLNEMIYNDDEQYRSIEDRIKDTNFVFKVGDNKWIKIPKARILSVFGSGAQRTFRASTGEKGAFAGYFETSVGQVGIINPIEANILRPFADVATNKTWYGGEIEGIRLQSVRPSQRYDESTTGLSKAIVGRLDNVADKMNMSPKKLDYLLDAYSGIIGDVAMPLMTSKAEPGIIQKAFTIDTVTSNRIAGDYYDALDEIKYKRNEGAGIEYDVMNRYMGRVGKDLADKYKKIREIQSGIGTDKYKSEEVRKIKDSINQVQLQALDQLKTIREKAKSSASSYSDLEKDKQLDALSDEILGKTEKQKKKELEIDEAFL